MNMNMDLYHKMSDPLAAIQTMGTFFAKSGLFGCDRPEQGMVLAMICMIEKRSPTYISSIYDIVEGKLRKKAVAILAEFRREGGSHKWLKTGDDGVEAVLQLTSKNGDTLTSTYSMTQAKQAGLIKDRSAWVKTPGNMLRARAITNGLAMLCPELVIAGGEVEMEHDQPLTSTPPKNVTPLFNDPPASGGSQPIPAMATGGTLTTPIINADPVPQPVPVPVPAATQPAPVAEPVAQVVTPPPAPAVQAPATAASPTPPQPPAKPTMAEATVDPKTGLLTVETQQVLLQIIGGNDDAVYRFMLNGKWLQPNQSLAHLSPSRATKVLQKPEAFLKAVANAEAALVAAAAATKPAA